MPRTPRRASVWTCSDTPRETGSDTSWPMPPWSAALNTWMVRRPPGSTVTFTLTGWSTAPTADWKISVDAAYNSDLTAMQTKPQLSADMINNGKTVTLTLTVPAGDGMKTAIAMRAT